MKQELPPFELGVGGRPVLGTAEKQRTPAPTPDIDGRFTLGARQRFRPGAQAGGAPLAADEKLVERDAMPGHGPPSSCHLRRRQGAERATRSEDVGAAVRYGCIGQRVEHRRKGATRQPRTLVDDGDAALARLRELAPDVVSELEPPRERMSDRAYGQWRLTAPAA